jgi:hypothetical protein
MHDPSGLPPHNALANPKPDANQIMEYDMQRINTMHRIEQLNTLRLKEMTEDTLRLLQLAKEVHQKTITGDPAAISAFELNKVEAIEKLARSVREKMAFTVSP